MKNAKLFCLAMGFFVFGLAVVPLALADDAVVSSAETAVSTSTAGVEGCSSVSVDPEQSLEFQQNICSGAERNTATSCSAGGHGSCSSPKTNDVLSSADHCICIAESETSTTAEVIS